MNKSAKRESLEEYLAALREQREYHVYNRRIGISNGDMTIIHRSDRKIADLDEEIKTINNECLDEMLKDLG